MDTNAPQLQAAPISGIIIASPGRYRAGLAETQRQNGEEGGGSMTDIHVPVLLSETLTHLNLHPEGRYVDGTLGGGGHAAALLEATFPTGQLLAIDRYPAAVERFAMVVDDRSAGRLTLRVGSYAEIPDELRALNWRGTDGILLDLGLSSLQLDDPVRGFSFAHDGVFDLRFDPTRGRPAYQLFDQWSVRELTDILGRYGELRSPRRLAEQLLTAHRRQPLVTTHRVLAASGLIHPRRRAQLFQAIRIAVNDELGILERSLPKLWEILLPGGRLVIITFQSLEDRIVKQQFRTWAAGDHRSPGFAVRYLIRRCTWAPGT
jgi:16S rRNA (cytosine1402-N4)-methyltransferase